MSKFLPSKDLSGNVMSEFDYMKVLQNRGFGNLDKKMGIEIIEASPLKMVGKMPVEGNQQAIGLLHGGANVVLAESLGSIGTALFAGSEKRIVGIEVNASHHKAALSGFVMGVATPVSLGKTLCSYQIEITNEKGETTCSAKLTCLILNNK